MEDLFKQVPPGLRMNMTTFLHGSTVAHVPLFRGLSGEVVESLCNVATPMYVMKVWVKQRRHRTHAAAQSSCDSVD